jgi:uncharacterized membrane protein (UPF0127 family)
MTGRIQALSLTCALSLLFCLGLACKNDSGAQGDVVDGLDTLRVVSSDGKTARLTFELADEPQELTTGLMNRTELNEDAGMLFVLGSANRGFWMKDTLIPLSVAFISDCGQIVHIEDMEPQSLQIHNSPTPYYFALEVNQGWFTANGIGVGSQVMVPEALKPPGCAG